mmetsp:Transcript_45096/g.97980  ORF Transcript_45096/g.97980 Transcript_45096/m.97980 type:complete len:209 (+) Transcript_45096:1218-1844(+)
MLGRRVEAHQKRCFAAAADRPVKDSRQLTVSHGYMRAPCCQSAHHVSEGKQALVDGGCLLQLGTLRAAFLHPLRPCQIYDRQPGSSARHLPTRTAVLCVGRCAWSFRYPNLEHEVTPARSLVHLGLSIHQIRACPHKRVEQHLRLAAFDPCESRHDAALVHTKAKACAPRMVRVKQIIDLLHVNMHSGGLHIVHVDSVPSSEDEEAGY